MKCSWQRCNNDGTNGVFTSFAVFNGRYFHREGPGDCWGQFVEDEEKCRREQLAREKKEKEDQRNGLALPIRRDA